MIRYQHLDDCSCQQCGRPDGIDNMFIARAQLALEYNNGNQSLKIGNGNFVSEGLVNIWMLEYDILYLNNAALKERE